MVAIDINGTIQTYNSIPKSWGNIIGVNYMTEEEQNDLGFYNVEMPTTKPSQELGDIYFDSSNSVFTYPVENKTFSQSLAELKEQKIKDLKSIYNLKLSQTDWYIIRSQEGTSAPQDVLDTRASLRTECATKESEINSKTTKAQVVDYELPSL